jgi:glycerophosphoryl diester phosphodiesterase
MLKFVPPVIAHRGASSVAPENTLMAMQLAYTHGALWIEIDARVTADGVAIVLHDATVDRTTTGKGRVANMNYADLEKFDAGIRYNSMFAGEKIPRLAEALSLICLNQMRVNVEMKFDEGQDINRCTMAILGEIRKTWPKNYPFPLISSFNKQSLSLALKLCPDWPRALLLESWHKKWIEDLVEVKATTLNIGNAMADYDDFKQAVNSGCPIIAYTVNAPDRAKDLYKRGVVAVITDTPRDIILSLKAK